ncbi:MAG: hypothetical protein ABI867_22880 [Kofleriaceae bacterium]
MSKINLAVSLLCFAGCASDSSDDVVGDDDAPPFTNGVSTLSGGAEPGYLDGARGTAQFNNPVNVLYSPNGDRLFVADFDNSKLRAVDVATGETTTVVAQQNFQRPFAMAFAADGTLYVTTDNDASGSGHGLMSGTIWRVDVGSGVATVVAEQIGKPRGLVALPDGRLAVSDYQHHVIELVDPTTGLVTPLAGTWDVAGMVDGVGAKFSTPYGLALKDGWLAVADWDNNRIRRVNLDGSVSTLAGAGTAGFADGTMSTALFAQPQGLVIAANGDLFVTDLGNYRIRKISGDSVTTVAGSGEGGYVDSDDRLAAEFYGLEGMSLKADGSMLFVADGTRGEAVPFNRIRSIKTN